MATNSISRFFNRADEVVNQSQDATRRKAIEVVLAPRDKIAAELAKGDAAVLGDLQELFIKTRAATRSAGAPVAESPSAIGFGYGRRCCRVLAKAQAAKTDHLVVLRRRRQQHFEIN